MTNNLDPGRPEGLLEEFPQGQPSHEELYRDYHDSAEGEAAQDDADSIDETQG